MSSQKGNIKRTRPQKYQNIRAYKNDLYGSSKQTKFLNTMEITDVCHHCKGILEWRIKYKKYKVLKGPRTCVKCNQKNVVLSYRTMCAACAVKLKQCPKCGKTEAEIKSTPIKDIKSLKGEEDDTEKNEKDGEEEGEGEEEEEDEEGEEEEEDDNLENIDKQIQSKLCLENKSNS